MLHGSGLTPVRDQAKAANTGVDVAVLPLALPLTALEGPLPAGLDTEPDSPRGAVRRVGRVEVRSPHLFLPMAGG